MNKVGFFIAVLAWVALSFPGVAAPEAGDNPLVERYQEVEARLAAGQWTEAEPLIREVLSMLETEMDVPQPTQAFYQLILGKTLSRLGKHDEAMELLGGTVEVFDQRLGAENPLAMEARSLGAVTAREVGRPEDTVTFAGPLLETLREYVGSGRARTAAWDQVVTLQNLFPDQPIHYDEARIGAVAAMLGLALAELGKFAEAEAPLREAAAALEATHGSGHPERVRVREALEAVALARGDAIGRRFVGEMGTARRIKFVGNQRIPAKDLRGALNKDMAYILASHPAAPFADLLDLLPDRVRAGYLHSGFPDVAVEADYRPRLDGGQIEVRITEGPRFRKGRIRVEGGDPTIRDALVAAMQRSGDDPVDATFPRRIRSVMSSHLGVLPIPPEAATARAALEAMTHQVPMAGDGLPDLSDNLSSLNRSSGSNAAADWALESPVRFVDGELSPFKERVRYRLAELGHPLAEIETAYLRNSDGTADLEVRILDAGREAIVGTVSVIGNTINTADDVRRAAGLHPGQPLLPEDMDDALAALWHCGRFFPFEVRAVRTGLEKREVDVLIRVHEIAGIPSLSEPDEPGRQAVLAGFRHLNEGTFVGDLLLDAEPPMVEEGEHALIGWSPGQGVLLDAQSKELAEVLPLVGSDRRYSLALLDNRLFARLGDGFAYETGAHQKITANQVFAHFVPTVGDEDRRFQFIVGMGYGTEAAKGGAPVFDLLVHSSAGWIKTEDIRVEGDAVVLPFAKGPEIWFHAADGSLMNDPRSILRMEKNAVRSAVATLRAEAAASPSSPTDPASRGFLATAIRSLAEWLREENPDPDQVDVSPAVELVADLLERPELFVPLRDFFSQWGEDDPDDERVAFSIPPDPGKMRDGTMLQLLLSLGALAMAEEYLPPDSWLSSLARELMFVVSGQTQYTAETMDRLLNDPTIGPLGCVVCAQALNKIHPPTASRFLGKALEQATAEAFRNDWQLLIDSPIPLAETLEKFLVALSTLSPEDEETMARIFADEDTGWVSGFFDRLRDRPSEQSLADWIAPSLDRLWQDHLVDDFRIRVQQARHPMPDGGQAAARVNGLPVPLWLVRAQREHPHPAHHEVLGHSSPAGRWSPPELARAIRLELVRQGMAARNLFVDLALVEQQVSKMLPHLVDATDEQWQAATGLTRTQFLAWTLYYETLRGATQSLAAGVAEPTESEVERWYEDQGGRWGDRVDLVAMVVRPAHGLYPSALARAERMAIALSPWLAEEPAQDVLHAALKAETTMACSIKAYRNRLWSDLNADLRDVLGRIQLGEVTEPILLGDGITVFVLSKVTPGTPPPLESVRREVSGELKRERAVAAMREWAAPLEASAQVEMIDPTDDPDPLPASVSVFDELLLRDPGSVLGQLGKARENGDFTRGAATQTVDRVLEAGVLDATALVRLCAGYVDIPNYQSAKRCLKHAAALDPTSARAELGIQIRKHDAHNNCAAGRNLRGFRTLLPPAPTEP